MITKFEEYETDTYFPNREHKVNLLCVKSNFPLEIYLIISITEKQITGTEKICSIQ